MIPALPKTPTIDDQITMIMKVKAYKIFEDDLPLLNAVLDTLIAARLMEYAEQKAMEALDKVKDPMRITR